MKRWVAMLIVGSLVLLGQARAQSYAGFGLSHIALSTLPQYGLTPLPFPEVQVGGLTAPEFGSVELRASLGTILLFSNVGVDALAAIPFPEAALRLYFGGGPDLLVFMGGDALPGQASPQVFFGAHGTVGLEFLSSSARPFLELQPAVALLDSEAVFGLRARAGLNISL